MRTKGQRLHYKRFLDNGNLRNSQNYVFWARERSGLVRKYIAEYSTKRVTTFLFKKYKLFKMLVWNKLGKKFIRSYKAGAEKFLLYT